LRLGTIFKIHTSLGQIHEFVEDDTGALCCRVNSCISKDHAPSTINFGGLSIIPSDAMPVQTSMLCVVPFNTVQSVSKVEHHSKFIDAHYGYFRVYSVQYRLDVSTGEVSDIPAEEHKTSSQAIHKRTYPDFESYPEIMHDVCTKVSGVVVKMLCRVAQSQQQTNFEQMYVPPGIWEMLATHMRQGFKSPSHPFFIDQTKHRVTKKQLQYVDEILELQTMMLELD
jgi:hypothetical protein